jgi:hypothetical protein
MLPAQSIYLNYKVGVLIHLFENAAPLQLRLLVLQWLLQVLQCDALVLQWLLLVLQWLLLVLPFLDSYHLFENVPGF